MTRKTSTDKDGGKASKTEGRDHMKLKTMLEEFVEGGCKVYNEDMDDIIHDITLTGVVRMPWKLLKPLLKYKIDTILKESFDDDVSDTKDDKQVVDLLEKFNGPPFTIQRICELVKEPCKSYRRKDRYIRALQKNLLVVTTLEPDLVWMKVPNLSALLDPKAVPIIPMPAVSSPDPINEKEPVMSRDLPSPSWKLPRSPISPRSPRSPRSRTPPPDFESAFVGRNWEGLLEPHPILFRKRTSGGNTREPPHSVGLHVQLQEADSTVPDQPLSSPTLEEETVGGQKRHRSDSDEETGILKAILSIQSTTTTTTTTATTRQCGPEAASIDTVSKIPGTSEEDDSVSTCESSDGGSKGGEKSVESDSEISDDSDAKKKGVSDGDEGVSEGDEGVSEGADVFNQSDNGESSSLEMDTN